MFKKLKGFFQDHETAKQLQSAALDSTQNPINFLMLRDSSKCLASDRSRKPYLDDLFKGLQSSKWVKRLKFMIAIHYLIVLTENEELIDRFMDYCSHKVYQQPKSDPKVTDVKTWIESCVVTHYQSHIQKICTHLEFYSMCKKSSECEFKNRADLIVAGFKAVNMVNFILETKVNFNKLGRYYQQLRVILDLFKMYLRDINIIYNFLKLTLDELLLYPQRIGKLQLKHSFAFINQTLKTSDQLYQFYYNRYYYKSMKEFNYPVFYKLDYKKYKYYVKFVKKNIPAEEFMSLEIYFSAHRRDELYQNKTLMTLNRDEQEFCSQIEKTLMEWEISRHDETVKERYMITEDTEEQEEYEQEISQ